MAERQNADDVTDGVRSRKTTEKGAQYQLSVKQRVYKRALSAVRSSSQILIEIMSGNEDIGCVKAELENWMKLCQELTSADQELRLLLPEDEIDFHVSRHLSQLEDNDALKAKVMKYLTDIKPEEMPADSVEPQDSASNLFMTSRTVLSRVSQHSDGGSSTLSSAKLKEKQKQAELAARAAVIKKSQEMNKRKLELQCEEEDMKLMTELAVSQARERAINDFERDLNNPTRNQEAFQSATARQMPQRMLDLPFQDAATRTQAPQTNQQQRSVSNVHAPQTREQDQSMDVIQGLVNLLHHEVKQSHLPVLEPDVFYGDVAKFELWLKSFETYIEAKTSSPIERLHYLGKYTGGEAKAAILGFIQLRQKKPIKMQRTD